jgi:preprotein translocase subunit SecA
MDYLQEGIGLRAMAQRDPLVEYQREGFDMFAAMMDAVKEESVGFLFNLEVQLEEEDAVEGADGAGTPVLVAEPADDFEEVVAGAGLDVSMLKAAQEEHEGVAAGSNGAPHIRAKGLENSRQDRPLTYIAPDLGSEAPSVTTSESQRSGSGGSATAKRQQARTANPNRGSRGNRGASGRSAGKNKRKR